MSLSRLGGIALEPIPFDPAWVMEEANAQFREIIEQRRDSVQAYRFFYESGPNRVEGFLIEPIQKKEKLPCIVFNRGGTQNFGINTERFCYLSRVGALAERGYLAIASQYSGGGQSTGEDDWGGEQTLQDVVRLYDLLKEDPYADVSRIGVLGGSRGGAMTYLLMKQVSWIKAAVVMSGASNLLDESFRPKMQEVYTELFGPSREERVKRSVLEWVDQLPKNVPLLLMHGTADWRVNPLDTLKLTEACYRHKIPCSLIWYEGGDHTLTDQHYRSTLTAVVSWFNRYVRDGEPLPDLEPHGA